MLARELPEDSANGVKVRIPADLKVLDLAVNSTHLAGGETEVRGIIPVGNPYTIQRKETALRCQTT